MTNTIKVGDQVEWESSQGKIAGVVKKKLTKPMKIKYFEKKEMIDLLLGIFFSPCSQYKTA